jgi:hypothetical protein
MTAKTLLRNLLDKQGIKLICLWVHLTNWSILGNGQKTPSALRS